MATFAVGWGAVATIRADQVSLLVPAYFYPGGATLPNWPLLDAAAQSTSVTAIFNPASGPGTTTDPNYVSVLNTFRADGGHVVAYIPTDHNQGMHPLTGGSTSVEGMIQGYQTLYPGLYDGFFIDEMASMPGSSNANLTYYHDIYSYIKGIDPAFKVIGNPGTNPTVEDFLKPATQGADTLVTYENDAALLPYASYTPPSWAASYSASHFASVVYNEPTIAGMQADLSRATTVNNAGYVYVTDIMGGSPYFSYGTLPSYWSQEVAQIQGVPEPAGLTSLLSAGIACLMAMAWKRRSIVAL
jgi:hypothetical protein